MVTEEYPFEIHPVKDGPSIVDLSHVFANLVGSTRSFETTQHSELMSSIIGDHGNTIFILADGLGCHFVDHLGADSFLSDKMVMRINTVFPSTTAAALTTFATGLWPSEHAITGWWVYLPLIGEPVTVLTGERKRDNKNLLELGVESKDIYPRESILASSKMNVVGVVPSTLSASVFTKYTLGNGKIIHYNSIQEAFQIAIDACVRSNKTRNFVYLYLPDIDLNAHATGIYSEQTLTAVTELNNMCERMNNDIEDDTRVVMSADHGHLEAPESEKVRLKPEYTFRDLLSSEPAGDARVLYFRSRPACQDRLKMLLCENLGDNFAVMDLNEFLELEILGPRITPLSLDRLGDVIAISKGTSALEYGSHTQGVSMMDLKSVHSGLSRQEMEVPLIVF